MIELSPTIREYWNAFLATRSSDTPANLHSAFAFNDNERGCEELTALVLSGAKRATAASLWSYEAEGESLPQVGDLSIVLSWRGEPRCVIETTDVQTHAFEDVSEEFAAIEGEGDGSLRYWREGHWEYFGRECARLGRELSPRMPVVCEKFRVVYPPGAIPRLTLQAITIAELEELVASTIPPSIAARAAEGALLPERIARRALNWIAEGKPERWCTGFYMVRASDQAIVGSCGFKGAPVDGRVEIGYHVAPSCRNQGFASAAVRELVRHAFAGDEAREVLAQVNPENAPSTRVVEKRGFERGEVRPDDDGEPLVQWVKRK